MLKILLNQLRHRLPSGLSDLKRRVASWYHNTMSTALEVILQPSTRRLKAAGVFICISQPLIGIAWSMTTPQPFENLWLRFALGSLGLLLIWDRVSRNPESVFAGKVATAVFWIELPLFGCWMYVCNGGNTEWMVSLCCMVLIYYHLTDWRIATIGVITAAWASWEGRHVLQAFLPAVPPPPIGSHLLLFLFCWASAIALGASAANLRREHLKSTFHAMSVFAQDVRTSISIIGAVAAKLESQAFRQESDVEMRQTVDRLASQIHRQIRNVHSKVDTHVTNAGILNLAGPKSKVSAYEVIHEAVGAFPFLNAEQRMQVQVVIETDFEFISSFVRFSQGLSNLITNSLTAIDLRFAGHSRNEGCIQIHASTSGSDGLIRISDNGVGIPAALQNLVVEPFFTTHRGAHLGLGLTYMERLVAFAGGQVSVESIEGEGTIVTIRVPRTLPLPVKGRKAAVH